MAVNMKKKRKRGRPSTYTKERGLKILEVIAKSNFGLDRLHRKYKHPHPLNFPKSHTLMAWANEHADFAAGFARAKQTQAARLAEQQVTLADRAIRYSRNEGCPQRAQAVTQATKLAIEARRWTAARLAPRDWGDKFDVTSDGSPLVDWKKLTDLADEKVKD